MSFEEVYDDLYDNLYNVVNDEALAILTDVVIEDYKLNRFNYKDCLFGEMNVRVFVELRNCLLLKDLPKDYYDGIPYIDDYIKIKEYRDNYIKDKITNEYRGELWQLYYFIRSTLSKEQLQEDIEINFDNLMTDTYKTFDGLIGNYYYESCACVAHCQKKGYYNWLVEQFKLKGLNFKVK